MNAKSFLLLTIFMVWGLSSLSGQRKTIFFVDKDTGGSISFVAVYNTESNDFFTSNLDGKVDIPILDSIDYFWNVHHLSYAVEGYFISELLGIDTVFLSSKSYELESVVVFSEKLEKPDYLPVLNKIFKKYRNKKNRNKGEYAFYLESLEKGKSIEKIMAIFDVYYAHNKGYNLPYRYVDVGEFWFDESAPFLNLQTGRFILDFAPFARKKKNDDFYLPSNRKIKKKAYTINELHCKRCSPNEKKLVLVNNEITAIFYIDLVEYKIIEMEFSFKKYSKNIFHEIKSGNQVTISKLNLHYVLNDDHDQMDRIDFNIGVEVGGTEIDVNGFFKKEEVLFSSNRHFLLLGAYKADNIYEQISLHPGGNNKELLKWFSKYNTSSLKVLDTNGLSSSNEGFKLHLLTEKYSKNRYRSWNQLPSCINDFFMKISGEEHFVSPRMKLKKLSNEVNVLWALSFQDDGEGMQLNSYPTLYNVRQSKMYSTNTDTLNNTFVKRMVFDLYELSRRNLLDSLKAMKVAENDFGIIDDKCKQYYNKKGNEISRIANALSKNEMELIKMIEIDSLINERLNKSNVEWLFLKEIPRIFDDPKYESILDQIIQMGYKVKRNKGRKGQQLASRYFRKSIQLLKSTISKLHAMVTFDEKQLGHFYSRLAELYIVENEKEKACECLSSYKNYWKEDYAISRGRVWSDKNCSRK